MNISPAKFAQYARDPAAFRNDVLVDVDGNVRRFGEVQDDWQRDDFAAIDAGMMRCNGQGDDPNAVMRAYLERPRGHSKTTDLAIMCVWILAFATRPVKGYAFAADKDQAALLKDAMFVIVRLNPWLGKIIEIQKNLVLNIAGKSHPGHGARLEIFTSDVASSYGILPDFIICDELTHWEGDGSLWHSIISSAAKRSNCFLAVIANAGFIDSWQWAVRESARLDDTWYFHRLDGPQASWMTPERLAEQERMLPRIAYSRLWLNQWSSGGGDALTSEVIDAAFIDGLQPMYSPEPGYYYLAGVDLGLVRDFASVVLLAVPSDGRVGKIRLAQHKLWKPIAGQKINLLEVEQYLLELDRIFRLEFCVYDPWQCEHLMQSLEADTGRRRRNQRHFFTQPWAREIPPTAANLRQQATLTIESFNDRRLQLFDCEPLRRDLHKLRVEETQSGNSFRLVSPRDGDGHGDSFSAFVLSLVVAQELAAKPRKVIRTAFGPGVSNKESLEQRFANRERQYQRDLERLAEIPNNPFLDALRSGTVNIVTPSDSQFHRF
jgi:hypothetical protein